MAASRGWTSQGYTGRPCLKNLKLIKFLKLVKLGDRETPPPLIFFLKNSESKHGGSGGARL